MARAATAPELALYRAGGKWTRLRAAILQPTTIYTARINQVFPSWDGVLEFTYDSPSGTLADVLPDMTVLIGSSAGGWDKGITRLRSIDASKVYIGETSDIKFADNDHVTIVDDFGLWARHVLIDDGEAFMDGGVEYDDQHTDFDPVPIMGSHRVLKLTGATVSAQFSAAGSYAIDSSISGYAWSAPGSSSSSGMTTSTPTISWNSVGWKKVYLTLTAANGKTFFGVRYVYVWSDDSPPSGVQIGSCREEAEEGGWTFDITLLDDCDVDTVRDHALVILFGEDYYGSTQSDIGPVTGCENIYALGWIARETINWNPEQGSVRFTAYAAHYWFGQIPSYPDGVEIVARPPGAWTEMQGLTVRKGLFHFLHWRTTATRIMDVFLPDDTKYTREVSSLAQNLWEQIREMAFLQIFARAGVNAQGQLYIEVHPQLVPDVDRDWPTVMTITEQDWVGEIDFERVTQNEVSQVHLSGVSVNENGRGTPYFSISTGHTYSHYGKPEIQENLLVSSQADTNQKAGLYYGLRNNPYPDIPIVFDAPIRLIDCFPRQKCNTTIDASDTPRAIEYSGGLIPRSVAIVQDPETGYVHSEVVFEAETSEAHAVKETVPGSSDVSIPPVPPLPPLPPIEILVPGTVTPTEDGGPPCVMLLESNAGLLYTENFNDDEPTWEQVNAGLGGLAYGTTPIYQAIHRFFVTPNGALYAGRFVRVGGNAWTAGTSYFFLARAPSIGSTFEILYDWNTFNEEGSPGFFENWGILAANYNPLLSEQVAIVMRKDHPTTMNKIYVGSPGAFVEGAQVAEVGGGGDPSIGLSYGLGHWLYGVNNGWERIAADGSSVIASGTETSVHVFNAESDTVVRASTTGRTYMPPNGSGNLVIGDDNMASFSLVTDPDLNLVGMACDPTGQYLMARWGSGLGPRGRSSDGGSSWGGMPELVAGPWYFANAGNAQRWIAAGGIDVRYTPDFGATWEVRKGNLESITPIPNVIGVKVIKF